MASLLKRQADAGMPPPAHHAAHARAAVSVRKRLSDRHMGVKSKPASTLSSALEKPGAGPTTPALAPPAALGTPDAGTPEASASDRAAPGGSTASASGIGIGSRISSRYARHD